jgi:hypothetical protein
LENDWEWLMPKIELEEGAESISPFKKKFETLIFAFSGTNELSLKITYQLIPNIKYIQATYLVLFLKIIKKRHITDNYALLNNSLQ